MIIKKSHLPRGEVLQRVGVFPQGSRTVGISQIDPHSVGERFGFIGDLFAVQEGALHGKAHPYSTPGGTPVNGGKIPEDPPPDLLPLHIHTNILPHQEGRILPHRGMGGKEKNPLLGSCGEGEKKKHPKNPQQP
jgi:hypothetical protein